MLGKRGDLWEISLLTGFNFTAYEEDADGFQFSRKPTKKPRTSVEAVTENPQSDLENAPPKATPKRGRPSKKQKENATSNAGPTKGSVTELPVRKTTRGNAKGADAQPESETQSARLTRQTRHHDPPSPELPPAKEKKRGPGRPGRTKKAETNGFTSPEQPPPGTKIALPVADTPVIQRNKELRGAKSDKGGRRSSLGMRGRRASSLIDTGASSGRCSVMHYARGN